MRKMNGYRVTRKYIEGLSDEDLHGLWESAKKDDSQEAMVILHLIICEFANRRLDPPK